MVLAIAAQLGFDAGAADRTLLPAMEIGVERAARVVRDRLLVEPNHWFVVPDDTPPLPDVAPTTACRNASCVPEELVSSPFVVPWVRVADSLTGRQNRRRSLP